MKLLLDDVLLIPEKERFMNESEDWKHLGNLQIFDGSVFRNFSMIALNCSKKEEQEALINKIHLECKEQAKDVGQFSIKMKSLIFFTHLSNLLAMRKEVPQKYKELLIKIIKKNDLYAFPAGIDTELTFLLS